jgi:hypothetical protein
MCPASWVVVVLVCWVCPCLCAVEEGVGVCAESPKLVDCKGKEHDLVVQEGLEVLRVVDLL